MPQAQGPGNFFVLGLTMKLPIYQIDAFTNTLFAGNPAAVMPLEEWLPDVQLQAVAAENNLSETAFFVPTPRGYHIRWFTPVCEVTLCGHATLASAYVVFNRLGFKGDTIEFDSRSGPLLVSRVGELLKLDFPTQVPEPCALPPGLSEGLQCEPLSCLRGKDLLAVFGCEADIKNLRPDFNALAKLDTRGIIATAPGDEVDFVARFFAPAAGIPEDPVTGSAYTQLTPYWAERLNKTRMQARQLSARGGALTLELKGARTYIYGEAVPFLEGTVALT